MKLKHILAAIILSFMVFSCRPVLYSLGLSPTCSNAVRTCQFHWLICAGACELTTDGVDLVKENRHLTRDEKCWKYRAINDHCGDVRNVSFMTAVCMDHDEGWCDHYRCNECVR